MKIIQKDMANTFYFLHENYSSVSSVSLYQKAKLIEGN